MTTAIIGRQQAEQIEITGLFMSRFMTGPDTPVPVAFPNRPFNQPTDGPWGRFSIRSGEVTDIAVGGLVARGIGLVYLQVFLLSDSGEVFARQVSDAFSAAFDNQLLPYPGSGIDGANDSGFIWFSRASMEAAGPRPGYSQYNCKVGYQHDRMGHGVGMTS